jgi:hypothetical protein
MVSDPHRLIEQPDTMVEVWQDVNTQAQTEGRKVTAAMVTTIVVASTFIAIALTSRVT